jgi:hypothetical protein
MFKPSVLRPSPGNFFRDHLRATNVICQNVLAMRSSGILQRNLIDPHFAWRKSLL